ncbi:MAG: hypothetical protein ABH807_02465 [Candidatus Shapirobacteria bacterium]
MRDESTATFVLSEAELENIFDQLLRSRPEIRIDSLNLTISGSGCTINAGFCDTGRGLVIRLNNYCLVNGPDDVPVVVKGSNYLDIKGGNLATRGGANVLVGSSLNNPGRMLFDLFGNQEKGKEGQLTRRGIRLKNLRAVFKGDKLELALMR